MKPTQAVDFVKAGDLCTCVGQTMPGLVLRVIEHKSGKTVVVRWIGGSTGRHSIATLVKLKSHTPQNETDMVKALQVSLNAAKKR